MSEVTMTQIDRATEKFAAADQDVTDAISALNKETTVLNARIAAIREKHLPAIRAAVKVKQARRIELSTLIEHGFALFKDPRTVEFHRTVVGMRWSAGSIEFDDEDRTVALIEKNLQPMAAILIKTKKTPLKSTIKNLSDTDLAQIGARKVGAGDRVVINPPSGDEIEKFVEELLRDPKK